MGKWDHWYAGLEEPEPFGDTVTYQMGAEWLADCSLVEDWGCGKGWMRKFVPPERYRGIDGSASPFADEIVDLAEYRSEVPGVFIRHVLEHNFQWAAILGNALASAQERLFLVLFTPVSEFTHVMVFAEDPGVPDLSFRAEDLTGPMIEAGFKVKGMVFNSATQYGIETVFWCVR